MGASLLTNVLALADTLGVKKDFHVDADREYSFSNPLRIFGGDFVRKKIECG